MTLHELIGDFADLIDAQTTADVSTYQRLDPPEALRVQVIEGAEGEGGEYANDLNDVAGGTHFQRMHVVAIVEAPWDENESTAAAIDALVEVIKAVIYANRTVTADDGVDADVGRFDGQQPFFAHYPGHPNTWIKGRYVLASWRV